MPSDLEILCRKHRISARATYGNSAACPDDWSPPPTPWTVRLTRRDGSTRRTLTVPFWTGPASTKEPSAADVLSCLISDATFGEQSFENFCHELGYDTDSRRAEVTYNQCRRLAPKVRRFLGDLFDDFASAQH